MIITYHNTMDLIITLTCEYIFDETECVTYCNSSDYEYVYKEYNYYPSGIIINKKRIRKLKYVTDSILSEYPNVMQIRFDDTFDKKITSWPNNLSHLIFGKLYNLKFPVLPKTVIYLKLGCRFDHDIMHLPNGLKYLELGQSFGGNIVRLPNKLTHFISNQTIWFNYDRYECVLPDLPNTIIYLKLGDNTNQEIKQLSKNLRYLHIGYSFNHVLPKLPDTLIYLKLGTSYSHKLYNLPHNLVYLELGHHYNHKLPKISSHLKQLMLGQNFNNILPNINNITHLTIERGFNSDIHKFTMLPPSLTHLTWINDQNSPDLPSSLTHLTWICKHKPILPQSLTHLTYYKYNHNSITLKIINYFTPSHIVLPDNITYLDYDSTDKLYVLPKKLTHLIVRENINYDFKEYPSELTHIEWKCNHTLPILPDSLKQLKLGPEYHKKITKLPNQLIRLIMYNCSFTCNLISNRRVHIEPNMFPEDGDCKIKCTCIPPVVPKTLKYLELNCHYITALPELPDSIEELWMQYNYEWIGEIETNKLENLYRNKIHYIIT
jgi:hypothetical protein